MKKFIVLMLFALFCAFPMTSQASWVSLGESAKDIAVEDNTLWIINGNGAILLRTPNSAWREYQGSGQGQAIAAARGTPWIIGMDNTVYRGTGSGWAQVPGDKRGIDIAVDHYGRVWIIGTDHRIYYHLGNDWREYAGNGQGKAIAVSPEGVPYVIGLDNAIYRGTGSGWVELAGGGRGTDIAVARNGTPWMVGMDQCLYSHQGGSWHKASADLALRLSVDLTMPYVIGKDDAVWNSR